MADPGVLRVSPEARRYALEELCLRAGMRASDWARWRVEAAEGAFVLRRIDGGSVVFPIARVELRSEPAVRKGWFRRPAEDVRTMAPNFVVAFCSVDSKPGEPLFVQVASGEFRCTEDLLASIALVLSRFEEIDAPRHDEHGRFRATDSIASRDGYLDRPIVDEYGLALEQVIATIDPEFRVVTRRACVKVSHDVDLIGIPFGFREPAVQVIARREIAAGMRDLLSGITGTMPGSLRQVIEICELAQARGLHSALYWKASARTAHDSGYDIADRRVAQVMEWARSRAVEMGVHPGYDTFGDEAALHAEVERLSKAIGAEQVGGRQHYLRWSPETWRQWEQCGLAYDSTVGFADRAGFRAGTCRPYFPWLWKENRRAELLEIPLIVMDQTLVNPLYMGCSPDESLAVVRDLMRKCAAVGGVFTLLWHNNCLGRPFSGYYPRIFDALAGTENYDWGEDARRIEETRRSIRWDAN